MDTEVAEFVRLFAIVAGLFIAVLEAACAATFCPLDDED